MKGTSCFFKKACQNPLVTCQADLHIVCVSKHMRGDAVCFIVSVKASVVGESEASFGRAFGDSVITGGLIICARQS